MQNPNPDPRNVPNLLVATLRNFASLMQKEMQLARAELSENISRAATGVAIFGVAALLALTALNLFAGAVVSYLVKGGLSAGAAASVVGLVLLVTSLVLCLMGRSRLTASALEPKRTIDNLQKDATSVKEATHG